MSLRKFRQLSNRSITNPPSRRRLASKRQLVIEALSAREMLAADFASIKEFPTRTILGDIFPTELVSTGNQAFFVAETPDSGPQLWRTDGTTEGTIVLTMSNAFDPFTPGLQATFLEPINSKLIFPGYSEFEGTELWITDGTPNGTKPIKDLTLGPDSTSFGAFVVHGDTFYFTTRYVDAMELWKTDGTPSGTIKLKTFEALATEYNQLAVLGDTTFFVADDSTHGIELWKTDGSVAGTVLVEDIVEGSFDARITELAVIDDYLFFNASGLNTGGLWKVGLSDSPPVQIKTETNEEGLPVWTPKRLFTGPDALYLLVEEPNGESLWRSDGTSNGTTKIKEFSSNPQHEVISDWTVVGANAFFVANDGVSGPELWITDGTIDGTRLVKDIAVGSSGSQPRELSVAGGQLYFSAIDGQLGRELWTTDGTSEGTQVVYDANVGSGGTHSLPVAQVDNRLLALTRPLSEFGTGDLRLSVAIIPPPDFAISAVAESVALEGVGGKQPFLFKVTRTGDLSRSVEVDFSAQSVGINAADATDFGGVFPAGTIEFPPFVHEMTFPIFAQGDSDLEIDESFVVSISNPPAGSTISQSTAIGRILNDDYAQPSLGNYSVNAGPIADLNPGIESGATGMIGKAGNRYVFYGTDGIQQGVWSTDGTTDGIAFLSESIPGVYNGPILETPAYLYYWTGFYDLWQTDGHTAKPIGRIADTTSLIEFDGAVFAATSGFQQGGSVYRIDQTTDTITNIFGGTRISNLVQSHGKIYFHADTWPDGPGIWETLGTAESTRRVYHGSATNLIDVDGVLYFSNADGQIVTIDEHDRITLITEQGDNSFSTTNFGVLGQLNDVLYLEGFNSEVGIELMRLDGNDPVLVKDFRPGPWPLNWDLLMRPIFHNDYMVFGANDGTERAMWSLRGGGQPVKLISSDHTAHYDYLLDITFVGARAYFRGPNANLWTSDGTAEGTYQVLPSSIGVSGLKGVGDQLFFLASTNELGQEPWVLNPRAITISNPTMDELQPVGSVVGELRASNQDGVQDATFTFVNGPGDSDNHYFALSERGELVTRFAPDFEEKAFYSIRLKAVFTDGTVAEQALGIAVNDVDASPVLNDIPVSLTVNANGQLIRIAPSGFVSHLEGNFDGGTLAVHLSGHAEPTDSLHVTPRVESMLTVSDSDGLIHFGDEVIGSFSQRDPYAIVVALNGNAAPEAITELVRSISFSTAADNDSSAIRILVLQVTDGDGDSSGEIEQSVDVIVPEIEISEDNRVLNLHDAEVSFGMGKVGELPPKEILIKNLGKGVLHLSNVELTGNAFRLVSQVPTSILPSDSAVLQIAVVATTTGDFQSTLLISNDDSSEGSFAISLSATLTQPTYDFGNAPEPYPTTRSADGARHLAGTLRLGTSVETEGDGVAGDLPSDNDGVRFITSLVVSAHKSTTASIDVASTASGKLDAWIDFNQDGDWDDPNEAIFQSIDVSAGRNLLSFEIPADATTGLTYSRFRLSSVGNLSPTGPAGDGEVEDYAVTLATTTRSITVQANSYQTPVQFVLQSSDIIVQQGNSVLFRGPVAELRGFEIQGTIEDDLIEFRGTENLGSLPIVVQGGGGSDHLKIASSIEALDLTKSNFEIEGFGELSTPQTSEFELTLDGPSLRKIAKDLASVRLNMYSSQIVQLPPLWRASVPVIEDGILMHVLRETDESGNAIPETALLILNNGKFFTNPLNPYDVNRDGKVNPLDALSVINNIEKFGLGTMTPPTNAGEISTIYPDVSGDNARTPIDALRIINALQRGLIGGAPEGESSAGAWIETSRASYWSSWSPTIESIDKLQKADWDYRLRSFETPSSFPAKLLSQRIDDLMSREDNHWLFPDPLAGVTAGDCHNLELDDAASGSLESFIETEMARPSESSN